VCPGDQERWTLLQATHLLVIARHIRLEEHIKLYVSERRRLCNLPVDAAYVAEWVRKPDIDLEVLARADRGYFEVTVPDTLTNNTAEEPECRGTLGRSPPKDESKSATGKAFLISFALSVPSPHSWYPYVQYLP
jgi:hypothetical protein